MISNNVFFVLLLMTVPLPSNGKSDCYWGTKPWCVNVLRSILWFAKDTVDNICCKSPGTDEIVLCSQKDFQGNCVSYHVPEERCVRVNTSEPIMSAKTFCHCYRLYEREDCTGESFGVQPGSGNDNFKAFLSGNWVSSLSRCFRSDLCVIHTDKSIDYKIGCHWPNDRLQHGILSWLKINTQDLKDSPIRWYQTGRWTNRTDVMHAHIYPHHIRTGPPVDENVRKYVQEMGFPGDDVGLILPRRFTGSGSDLRNVFPRSRDFKRRKWNTIKNRIEEIVRRYGSAFLTVNLAYHLVTDTRPYLFIYRIRPGDLSSDLIMINDLVNPQPE